MSRAQLYVGDALDVLQGLPSESVQCCVTSPPYWGLRDYGVEGQLGLEPTPQLYVEDMVTAFQAVRRVLKVDGTLWLNLGDSYAGSWGAQSRPDGRPMALADGGDMLSARQIEAHPRGTHTGSLKNTPGLKPKDLVGIPWRVAFALQADGWWLRSDIIWSKPNPMPESVTDRPTKAHEYVFLLTKSERYFYDADAIRTPTIAPTTKMPDGWDTGSGAHGSFHRNGREKGRKTDKQRGHGRRHAGFDDRWDGISKAERQEMGANARTVWEIATKPYAQAHFATFPPELASRCIKAGSKPGDTVLDPFGGSGTTASVATGLGRNAIYIDLNPDYLELARNRIGPLLCDVA